MCLNPNLLQVKSGFYANTLFTTFWAIKSTLKSIFYVHTLFRSSSVKEKQSWDFTTLSLSQFLNFSFFTLFQSNFSNQQRTSRFVNFAKQWVLKLNNFHRNNVRYCAIVNSQTFDALWIQPWGQNGRNSRESPNGEHNLIFSQI